MQVCTHRLTHPPSLPHPRMQACIQVVDLHPPSLLPHPPTNACTHAGGCASPTHPPTHAHTQVVVPHSPSPPPFPFPGGRECQAPRAAPPRALLCGPGRPHHPLLGHVTCGPTHRQPGRGVRPGTVRRPRWHAPAHTCSRAAVCARGRWHALIPAGLAYALDYKGLGFMHGQTWFSVVMCFVYGTSIRDESCAMPWGAPAMGCARAMGCAMPWGVHLPWGAPAMGRAMPWGVHLLGCAHAGVQ